MDIQPQSTPERIESSITNVTDSRGETVPHNTTTEDTVLTLSGRGTASSIVFIFDSGVLLTTASVIAPGGTWAFTETVALGRHVFTVRDSLGGVDSAQWVVTVGEAVVIPEITLVTDSNGEIEPDGTTFDTSITLTGTAKASEAVEIFQDGTSQGDVPVNSTGVWTWPVTGLTVRNHNFQVRGRYGNNPVSGVRSLTVLASDAPTISSIQDAGGVEIPPNTTTFGTSVTLTGTAAAGQQVQIYDGASSLGTVTAAGGTWTLPLTGLALKAYSIKAKGLYGSNPESAVRVFTVAVATAPTISNIVDAAGVEIPPNTTTYSASVTLTGTAAVGQQVQILDGTTVLGTVTATGGNWTLPLPSLTAKAYSIKAKGLYGSNPESAVRVFTVAVATAPTISNIVDAAGVEIPPNTTTYSASVTLSGTAAAGQQVQILDGATVLGTVTATGVNWTLALPSLTAKAYSIKAKGLYGSNPESAVRVFTVAVATAPTISNIVDAAGVEIPPNTTTYSASVTLTGTAAAGQQVQILDGATVLGTVTATGVNWTLALPSLAAKAYSIKAKGLYGSNPESAVRVFTVAVATVPTISSIKDANGVEIPPNTTTYSASVTLTGTAAVGQQVQILDGATVLGTVTATGGNWTLPLPSLTAKAYSIKAKGLYGSNPESAVRVFTVAVATVPTISSIKDANGVEIPPNTTTYSASVTLTGTAAVGQQVQILDGTTVLGTVTATGGNWTLPLPSLTAKAYSIKAKGLYGSNPESAARIFTVVQSVSGFENFEAEAATVLPVQIPIRCASGLTIKLLVPGRNPNPGFVDQIYRASVEPTPGFGLAYLMLRIFSVTEFRMPGFSKQVTIETWGVGNTGSQVIYYDEAGVPLGSLPIPIAERWQLVFTAQAGRFIASFEVRVASVEDQDIAVDNIRWTA